MVKPNIIYTIVKEVVYLFQEKAKLVIDIGKFYECMWIAGSTTWHQHSLKFIFH